MKNLLFSLVAMTLLLSCGSNDESYNNGLKDTPIKVYVSASGWGNYLTEVDVHQEEFYLRIKHKTLAKYSYYVLMKYDKDWDEWRAYNPDKPSEQVVMYWAGDDYEVEATAATVDFRETPVTFEVKKDQSTEENFRANNVYIMGTTSFQPSENGISVSVNYAMSMFGFSLTLNNVSDETNPVSDITISGAQSIGILDHQNNFNWITESGSVTPKITPFLTNYEVLSPEYRKPYRTIVGYRVVLIPQTIPAGEFSVSWKMCGKTYEYTFSADYTAKIDGGITIGLSYTWDNETGEMKPTPFGE